MRSLLLLAAETGETGGTGEEITFWICGTLAVLGALGLIFSRKTVHSALSVAVTMINLAVLFLINEAPFLGLVQVIVYTGAVMMLFLFVLMLVGVDTSDSFIETLKGQRIAAVLLILGFGILVIAAVGTALDGMVSVGLVEANSLYGGNVEGLAQQMFTTYLLALEVVAALIITAGLGAVVLAHRERWEPKLGQPEQSVIRMERYKETGEHPGPLPTPGVLATSNAVGTPALLPDGSPSDLSIPGPLRGEIHSRIPDQPQEIAADVDEVRSIASGEETERPEILNPISGHEDPEIEEADDERGEQ
ncbi:MAG: NADH:ubiquinone oxidoreductase subunit J [Micrococcales bacterium]|nr:NADH:ubiquinone oxidoreductase subunit J [Micrococcales bacterium]